MTDKVSQWVETAREIEDLFLEIGAGAFEVSLAVVEGDSLRDITSCAVPQGAGQVLYMRDAKGARGANLLFPAPRSFISSLEQPNGCLLVRGKTQASILPDGTCVLAYSEGSTSEYTEDGLVILRNLFPAGAYTVAATTDRVVLPGGFEVVAKELLKGELHFTRGRETYNFFFKTR